MTPKDHFFASLQNQNALLHAFARFFFRDDHGGSWLLVRPWWKLVVGGGVDIAVDDNGVLTLGEWCLLALHIRSFIHVFVRSFVPLFLCSFVRSFMLLLVLISLSTTMEY